MTHRPTTRNIILALIVFLVVFIGGLLLQGNLIITSIASLIGGIILLLAHLEKEPTNT